MRFAKEQIGKVFDLDRVDELFTDAIPNGFENEVLPSMRIETGVRNGI